MCNVLSSRQTTEGSTSRFRSISPHWTRSTCARCEIGSSIKACELLTDEVRHKVFSTTVQQLEQLNLVNIACDKLCHNRIKGATKKEAHLAYV